MPTTLDVFISSKMVELKAERDALYTLLPTLDSGDIQLRAWVFEEDAPASSKSIREVYLKALQNSGLYLGLFWNLYGEWTIDEFERATEWGMERHIYVKDVDADKRDPKLRAFLDKHGDVPTGITAKWFKTTDELCEGVKKSIETWITDRLRSRPGGTSAILAQAPDDLIDRPRQLFGRDELLLEVETLLDKGERVLLQGFGGMGKTALAATVAGEWIRAGKGAVLWLKTGSASVTALFESLARPFNAQQTIASQQGDAKIQAVRQLLHSSGVKLLVLDDCWNGQALFTIMTAVPFDLPVVVTARQRYALDNIIDIGEIKPDNALNLLLYHSKGKATDDAHALCKMLGYHAFAIEVAGKTLKARKWTPTKLLKEIKDAPHDLKTPADFSEKERSSVKDLLDISLNMLDAESRAVFLAFGVFFAPTSTGELLSLYVEKSVETALNILQINGLVERIPPTDEEVEYYRLHDLGYAYCRAQATREQRYKSLDACVKYTEKYVESSPLSFSALRPELNNFLGAVAWAFEVEHYSIIEELVENLDKRSAVLDYQGLYIQGIILLGTALEAAKKQGNHQSQSKYLNNLGNDYSDIAQYQQAIDCYQSALSISRQIGDKRIEGISLGNLGIVYEVTP